MEREHVPFLLSCKVSKPGALVQMHVPAEAEAMTTRLKGVKNEDFCSDREFNRGDSKARFLTPVCQLPSNLPRKTCSQREAAAGSAVQPPL